MNEYRLRTACSPVILQALRWQPPKRERSDGLRPNIDNGNERKYTFITHICVTNIVFDPRRMPADLYLIVGIDGKTTRSSTKPVMVGENVVEWDEAIVLPSERSSAISFKAYASFERQPMLENEILLCVFETIVGDLIDRNQELKAIGDLDKEVLQFPPSLKVMTERRVCDVDKSTGLGPPQSDISSKHEQLTITGHRALLRYRQLHNQRDLDKAIRCFERVRNLCLSGDPNHSTALFNLATVMFVRCQAKNHYDRLDVPVTLYHEALGLCVDNRKNRRVTTLDLCFALLAHLQTQGTDVGKKEVGDSPLDAVKSYAYGAAWIALQVATISVPMKMLKAGLSHADSGSSDDEVPVQNARCVLRGLSELHPLWSGALADLGIELVLRFEKNHHLVDIHEAISTLGYAVQLIPNGHPQKPALLHDLGLALYRRFQRLGDFTDLNKSIPRHEEVARLIPDNHPSRTGCLHSLAKVLSARYDLLGDLVDLEKSISKAGEAVHLTPIDHPRREVYLITFGDLLYRRFQCLGDISDLNRSIPTFEEGARLTPDGHPYEAARLTTLASMLFQRYSHLGDPVDINKSISTSEEAVQLIPQGHPGMIAELEKLTGYLICRFECLGDLVDINRSIKILENAVHLAGTSKLAVLNDLGLSLFHRFEHSGDLADIHRSISMLEEAAYLTPDGDPNMTLLLNNLGNSLCCRFKVLGDFADINKSISMLEEVVDRFTLKDPPGRQVSLTSLGNAFSLRSLHLGDPSDIHKSIAMFEKALHFISNETPVLKAAGLCNLGNSLYQRFELLGNIADINKSISMSEEALLLTPNNHPNKPNVLNSLGSALMHRSGYLGDLVDINKSISLLEKALCLTSHGSTLQRHVLRNLANSLCCRFEQINDPPDIDRSITLAGEVVHLTPDGDIDKVVCLGNLSSSLFRRFKHLGVIADLDRSISVSEQAVNLTPEGHYFKSAQLHNLGNSLTCRFEFLGDLADINRSILVLEKALHLTPDGHHMHPQVLDNLGYSLLKRFEHLRDLADLNKSILMSEEALHRLPECHHSVKSSFLLNLGIASLKHYEHSHDPSKLSAAIQHFSFVSHASAASTYVRFRAACRWIFSAHLQGNLQDTLDAYTIIINLLPQMAWMGLSLTGRHHLLYLSADMARDSAAAALGANIPEKAVEWLEQGRSIVWNQFLQLRSPVDELRFKHPSLADRFQQISEELERASSRGNVTGMFDDLEKRTVSEIIMYESLEEGEVQKHHYLTLEREKLLVEIRSLTGFDTFLLPKPMKQLAAFAKSGPVIYINASEHRCDALIVKAESENVIPVHLPGVKYQDVQFLCCLLLKRRYPVISRDDILDLVPSAGELPTQHFIDIFSMWGDGVEGTSGSDRDGKLQSLGRTPDDWLREILAFLWKRVINPILKALGLLTPPAGDEKLTRIFWCPTGPFAFLPIHAAGLYTTVEPGTKLSDFAISSYVPTLSSLAPHTGREANHHSSNVQLTTVAQPPNDGQIPLTCVKTEIDHIIQLSKMHPFVTLHNSDGTLEDVIEKMKTSDWVHFACHGVQDPEKPLDSGLCLADYRLLKLSDIIKLSRPQGGLAFLSACQTAKGDERLSEESVHLASGMLLAGYGGVIATMWSIMDRDAPKVTRMVYERLFRDGKVPNTTEAAEALHYSIQNLRKSGASLSSWVPFIHFGR